MKKNIFPFTLFSVLVLSFCTTSKKVAGVKGHEEPMTQYKTDISPIFQEQEAAIE